ncbi:uncharacterized protein LOC114265481 [Camellia sinensis]|uniref:uncharacterized protein LOC114265481 n=1 Tax=Camellia sinensis TaxID=4442 RepID=UPI001035B1FA|nr:uncharacterized protein LOC114265481 [Camellia sinensis]
MEDLMARIEKHARAKEDKRSKWESMTKQDKRNSSPKRSQNGAGNDNGESRLKAIQEVCTIFKILIYKILERIRNQLYYKPQQKVPGELMRRFHTKSCAYHDETRRKQEEHAKLAQAPPPLPTTHWAEEPQVINVVHLKVSPNEIKRKTWRVKHLQHVFQVQQKKPQIEECQGLMISFIDKNLEVVQHSHHNTLEVTLMIRGYRVRRILINQGSSCDIMYVRCYKQLSLHRDDLEPFDSLVVGFNGTLTWPLGSMSLDVQTRTKTVTSEFTVIDTSSP